MRLYVLDTDVLTLLQHLDPVVVAHRTEAIRCGHTVGLSIVTVEEQFLGWQRKLNSAKTSTMYASASRSFAMAVGIWGSFPISPETESSRATFEGLVRLKLNVGKNDLRIASVALELGAIVVTHNLVDYRRVPNLRIEDWAVP